MRQRLGVARCLLADPELLILDEPMNGLDPAGILEFRNLIRALVDEGRTVLLSSHLLDEVEKTCDHVAIVDRGEIVAQGPLAELQGDGKPRVLIGVDGTATALEILAAVPGVSDSAATTASSGPSLAEPRRDPRAEPPARRGGHPGATARAGCARRSRSASSRSRRGWRTTHDAPQPAPAPRVRPFGLARADLLKLRKRRGLFWTAALLIVVPQVIAYGILAILHAANPDHHGPAGGIDEPRPRNVGARARRAVSARSSRERAPARTISTRGSFANWSSPAARGSRCSVREFPEDLRSFSRSPPSPTASRPQSRSIASGDLRAPSATLVVESGLWVFAELAFYACSAVGLASLTGSRAYTIGILLAWRTAVSHILVSISALGIYREAFPDVPFDRFAPGVEES